MSDDSNQSFTERVEEIREQGEGVEKFHKATTQQTQWAIIGILFLVGGILGAASNPTQPGFGFLVIGLLFGGVTWIFVTKTGEKFREELSDNLQEQQQQQSSNSVPTVVCSNCGWQNPKANNFCHDCGERLDS